MFKLGITGGIGAGKSTACNFFKKKGASIFNADNEAKKYLNSNLQLQKKIINAYDNIYFNNKFNFTKLSEVAFSSKTNQAKLNKIMWPEIFKLIEIKAKKANKNNCSLFIVDAALLIEADFLDYFDSILLISTLKDIRIQRIINRGGLTLNQINKRIKLQMSDKEKKKKVNVNIKNNKNLDLFYNDLNLFYNKIKIYF